MFTSSAQIGLSENTIFYPAAMARALLSRRDSGPGNSAARSYRSDAVGSALGEFFVQARGPLAIALHKSRRKAHRRRHALS
ncbi:MAG: hypothetical protein CR217_08835 [Beijerinckiaceae bacterium]|nr:MAG: hypothetical protein CR217_08835 [Beijerinckiaceae bacterium]